MSLTSTPSLRLASVLVSAALCGGATVARADVVLLSGAASGQFSTAKEVAEFNAQTNTFTFTVENTTPAGSTSTITGIGFDLPPAGNASASGLNGFVGSQAPSITSTFTFSDADLGGVPGFNAVVLDFGFLTGPLFSEGTDSLGLAPGESATFTVTGAAFTGFTEAQLANAVYLFFEAVPNGVREDVAAVGSPTTPVPEPGTALLLGAGLAAVAARRRVAARVGGDARG